MKSNQKQVKKAQKFGAKMEKNVLRKLESRLEDLLVRYKLVLGGGGFGILAHKMTSSCTIEAYIYGYPIPKISIRVEGSTETDELYLRASMDGSKTKGNFNYSTTFVGAKGLEEEIKKLRFLIKESQD